MKSIVLLALAFSSMARAAELSWQECVAKAASDNAELVGAGASLKATEQGENVARSGFLPKLAANVEANQVWEQENPIGAHNTYATQLTLNQNLFAGFADWNRFEAARSDTKSAEQTLRSTKAKVSADLKQAFAGLQYAQEFLDLSASIVQRREENLRIVELRYDGGRENKGSVLLSRAYERQARYDDLQAKYDHKTSQAQLAKVLGLSSGDEIKLKDAVPVATPPPEPKWTVLAANTPDVQSAFAAERSAEMNHKADQGVFYPSVDLNGMYGDQDSKFYPENDRWKVALTLTLPIFSGGKDYATSRASYFRSSLATQNRINAERDALVKLRQAYADYVLMNAKADVDDAFRQAALIRADIARNKYNNGLMTFEEWDQVETDLINRQKAYLASRRDRTVNESKWEQAQGLGVIP